MLERSRILSAVLGASASLSLVACGSQNSLAPIELALLRPSNFTTTGSLVAGTTGGYVEFDVVRERDRAVIVESLATYITPKGLGEDQPQLRDQVDNRIFVERAIVVLGNGLDQNADGTVDPPPTSPPDLFSSPLLPYSATNGWQARATLGYTPGQTTIPQRSASDRFGVYFSSLLDFVGRIDFTVRDQLGQNYPSEFELTFTPAASQSVTVTVANATASDDQPLVISICNQLGAAAIVGINNGGSFTTLSLPQVQAASTGSNLSPPTSYRAEAYQFDTEGNLQRISSNPENPAQSTVTLLDAEGVGGNVSLTLVDSTDGTRTACFGDALSELRNILPNFF